MKNRRLIYYITAGFVIGTIILLVFQYITNTNIQELISGNENLLNEYRVNNELVGLQKDLLLLDNKIKTIVTTGDSSRIKDFEAGITKIQDDVNGLTRTNGSVAALTYMNELNELINQKIDFSHQMVDSLYRHGKPAAENQLAIHKSIKLSEEITRLTHKIDTSGRIALAQKIKFVDRSGKRVLNWNLYIIILVLILFTAVFLIIVNRMKTQADLINQLNTSEKKLKEAALIKENFLANMSHEIRTPLNAILGYTNLLQKKKLDEDSRLHVTTVQQSGETLLAIVNDILDLSKIESGMMRIEEFPFSINELVQSIHAMFHQKVTEKELFFETSMEQTIPDTVIGDATRLTQILVNLIGNAVKFTSTGKIKLDIASKPIDSDHVQMAFKVTDTGIGIEPKKLETIFERFRQAEDSTTRKYGGTGLGLSIVRDLIYLQNGNIEVKSEPGSGTIVSFTIPYKISANQENNFGHKNPDSTPIVKRGFKVLIAEDNRINQGLMSHLFTYWKIENTIVANGNEAVEALKKEHFDLVLMDIQMPEMDGYSATREIRHNLKLTVPIVAMTAHTMPGEREKCISSGMNEHISKPIREADLKKIITMFGSHNAINTGINKNIKQQNNYKIIDLQYMKEISNGDKDYEKLVTEQFLIMIPAELNSLSNAFDNENFTELKKIAHNMKTSISIMGLDSLLNDKLDRLENDKPDSAGLKETVESIFLICKKALVEANDFYNSF